MPIKEGTAVAITGGDFKGSNGTVVGNHNHDPVTYAVLLDKPVKRMVQSTVDLGGGKKSVTEEEVTFSRVEIAEADIAGSK